MRRRQERREPDADLNLPWSFCALTATPRDSGHVFTLNDAERAEASIAERLHAKKRVELVEEKVEPGSETHVELFVERAIALADEAAGPYLRRRAVLRPHPGFFLTTPELWERVAERLAATNEESADVAIGAVRAVLGEAPEASTHERVATALAAAIAYPSTERKRKLRRDWYDDDAPFRGAMFVSPEGVATSRGTLASADSSVEDEEPAEPVTEDGDAGSFRRAALPLDLHLQQVEDKARDFAKGVGLPLRIAETIAFAAAWHDKGKADPRFQKYLAGGAAPSPDVLLAKSGVPMPRGGANRRVRAASGLPPDWRHEVLSVRLAADWLRERGDGPEDIDAELALFLIGAHHGQGRPFFRHYDPWDLRHDRELFGAPLPAGAGPERLDFDWRGQDWAELFERLNARYGAWGLAHAEAMLRLADHRASEEAEAETRS